MTTSSNALSAHESPRRARADEREEVNRMLQIDTLAEDVVPTASIIKGH